MRRIHHATTDSTNERALAALAAGTARHLDVHVADSQSAGRGRRGRPWHSTPGEGLFLSLVWCPPDLASGVALTVAAGLGVLDAARALGAQGAALDWPNDVVLDGAKLAGVLVETRGLDPATPAYVVGVGLNVAQRTFPPELLLERPVTSLALAGVGASLPEVEAAVLEHLTRSLTRIGSDVAGLARDYLAAGRFQGLVSAATGQETLVGQILELDLDQGLLLETDTGRRRLPLDRLRRLEAAGRAPGAQ